VVRIGSQSGLTSHMFSPVEGKFPAAPRMACQRMPARNRATHLSRSDKILRVQAATQDWGDGGPPPPFVSALWRDS